MSLLEVTAVTGLSVLTGTTVTALLCVGSRQLRRTSTEFGSRIRDISPYLGAAIAFLLIKQATHEYRLQLSYALDWHITSELYAVEGEFVALLQDLVPTSTLGFFSAIYVVGFAFLLVTAPLLYFLLPSQRRLKELLVAYLLNYLIGSICYTLFIAYGPRNYLLSVDGLMYQTYPETQLLTAAISSNTNVFPSLHTSLAVVVLLIAWRSRREYPRWFAIVGLVASSVVFSTMYLGIHWLIDVLAGVVLGVVAVTVAGRWVRYADGDTSVDADASQYEDVVAAGSDD